MGVYRGTGVSRGVRPTTWERSLKKRELQIPCFEEFFWGENTLGLVPASVPHTLGYTCTLYTRTSPLPKQIPGFRAPGKANLPGTLGRHCRDLVPTFCAGCSLKWTVPAFSSFSEQRSVFDTLVGVLGFGPTGPKASLYGRGQRTAKPSAPSHRISAIASECCRKVPFARNFRSGDEIFAFHSQNHSHSLD